ncbi:MAG: O-antigen ligase family protein [Bacteroidota bacterium]
MRILLASIYPWIYVLLFLTIPFDNYVRALPNLLMIILAATFPFIIKKEHFRKLKKIPTILFALFCLYLVANAAIFGRLETDWGLIKKIALAFGFVVLYIPIEDSKKIYRAIVFSGLAVIIFSVINIFVIINSSDEIVLGLSRQVIEALLIDRIYLGMIAILSILISYQSIRKEFHPNNKYYLVNIIINVLFVVLLVSKIAIIILGLLLVVRQFYGKRKWLRVPVAALAVAGLFALAFSLMMTKEEADSEKTFLEQTLTWELRTEVWKCAQRISSDAGIIVEGFGFQGTKDQLVACYSEHIEDDYKRNVFVNARHNTHNQLVDIYFNWGVVAIVLFIGWLVVVFFRNRKEFIPTAYLIVLASYCLVEDVFHRQIGAYYVGFVLIAILLQQQTNENNDKKEA